MNILWDRVGPTRHDILIEKSKTWIKFIADFNSLCSKICDNFFPFYYQTLHGIDNGFRWLYGIWATFVYIQAKLDEVNFLGRSKRKDESDDIVLQTDDSKLDHWWTEAKHATSRSGRRPPPPDNTEFLRMNGEVWILEWEKKPRTPAWQTAALTTMHKGPALATGTVSWRNIAVQSQRRLLPYGFVEQNNGWYRGGLWNLCWYRCPNQRREPETQVAVYLIIDGW